MTNYELFDNLVKAIEEDRGVADVLKDKSEKEVKEVLWWGVKIKILRMEYSFLGYAIHKENYQAINDILQIAQKNGILGYVLAPMAIKEDIEILSHIHEDDVVRGEILDSAAKKLYEAIIIVGGKVINNDGVDELLSKNPDIASKIFKTGVFKYIFTHKEANELAEKVNKGKYEEVINIIQKRQALAYGILGVVMMTVGLGAFAIDFAIPISTPDVAKFATTMVIIVGTLATLGSIVSFAFAISHLLNEVSLEEGIGRKEENNLDNGDAAVLR